MVAVRKRAKGAAVAFVLPVALVFVLVGLLSLGARQEGSDRGAGDPADRDASVEPRVKANRLTDPAWKHVVIPPDDVLRGDARRLPVNERQLWGWNQQTRAPLGWVFPRHEPEVFPVFTGDGEVAGIGVAGIGLVSRAEFEDPAVDLEELARKRWGVEYDRMVNPPKPPGT